MGLYYCLTTNPKIKLFKLNIASLENNLPMSFLCTLFNRSQYGRFYLWKIIGIYTVQF